MPHASTAPRTFGEKRLDLQTSGHAKERAFIPLLPDVGTDCSRQGVLEFGSNAASVSQKSPSAGALNTERPSHKHREHVAEAAVQERSIGQTRSKAVRRYEWPLIINGVYQVRKFRSYIFLSGNKETCCGSKKAPLLLRPVSQLGLSARRSNTDFELWVGRGTVTIVPD